ncbi:MULTISPECIES: ExbD/TolR family protein [Nitrosomonas]|uniref:Biopolymer transport protein ExbD n=1 Tax=Nitrosomonas communis TaxID=44574 RepID=A0A0F7KHW8_9PROT|nr:MULTISPECIES: biopolymer transporter ExbD [Nitrosomonas]AKH38723.1 biopolymer transporter ExbD [Nitrosomonas communis]TYP94313.1 biopolymer transport protein ExbD [Nitrosomonas communis]UVS60801.1 biopolymer transporter ExbD [Nitrosomonas sp. PLL12]
MNFQRGQKKEEPEINLVPMIDVLLVILIFLVITTTYSKYADLEITLPEATATEADKQSERPHTIDVTVSATGNYTVNRVPLTFSNTEGLRNELQSAAKDEKNPVIIITADAKATHQSVITVMEAARLAGYNQVTFTTETTEAKNTPK